MISPLAAGLISFLVDGARSMLIAGTRSSGKCVSGDTLIQLSDGNILPIKTMIRGREENVEGDFVYKETDPFNIISLDNYNLENRKLSTYWKRRVDKKLVKIKTRSGKEIITTEEHPYYTFDKGIKSVFAGFIKKGQLIATPRKIKVQGKKQFIDLICSDKFSDNGDYYVIKGVTNSNPIKFPKYMDNKFAEFLGYLLADGHIDKTKISFFNSNKLLRERYKKLISMFDVHFREYKSRTTWVVQITSRLLSSALSKIFDIPLGKKSGKIKIPKEILMSDDIILSVFLRAYIDSDGYTPEGRRDLEICTKSKLMSQQLQLVFLRYGIVSFVKKKIVNGQSYYRILIRGNFVNKYAEHIGFNHPFKLKRLKNIFESNWIENTNVDIIPQGDYYLRELRKRLRINPKQLRLGVRKDYWAYENKEYRVSRKWFKEIIGFYEERYKALKEHSWKIDELDKFINFQDKYFESISLFNELRKLLDVSYKELASCTDFSDTCLRKILQKNKVTNLQNLNSMAGAYLLLKDKLNKLNNMSTFEQDINFLKKWVDNTPLTYADISRNTGISETMLKDYSYNNFSVPLEKEGIIINHLKQFKNLLRDNLERSEPLLKTLEKNFNNNLISYMRISMLLGELKNELNIRNDELISNNLHIQTVSNFFNSVSENPSLKTISEITKGVIKIYNESLSTETKEILDVASQLSNSDICWDLY